MTIAIISDIHGNLEALRETFSYIDKEDINTVYCLGDIVGYGPNPNECVELVRKRCKTVVLGNHDAAATGTVDISRFNLNARTAIVWTRKKLNEENRNFLKDLPYTYKENDLLFVHASPTHPESWTYVFSVVTAKEELSGFNEKVCFIGHTHSPVIYPNAETADKSNRQHFEKDKKYLVNAGSVGQPRDGDNRLCFCLYDTIEQNIEFIRLNYDIKVTSEKIISSGLPPFLAERLINGY